jgi:hypothetical protein
LTDERQLSADALTIAAIIGLDADNLNRSTINRDIGINKMVIAEVVMQYTLIEQVLGEIIAGPFPTGGT